MLPSGSRTRISAGSRQTVVAVRRAYQLTIDRREANALDGILAGCSSTEMMNFR